MKKIKLGGGGARATKKGEQGSSLEQDNYSTAGRAHERDLTCGIGSPSFVPPGEQKAFEYEATCSWARI